MVFRDCALEVLSVDTDHSFPMSFHSPKSHVGCFIGLCLWKVRMAGNISLAMNILLISDRWHLTLHIVFNENNSKYRLGYI